MSTNQLQILNSMCAEITWKNSKIVQPDLAHSNNVVGPVEYFRLSHQNSNESIHTLGVAIFWMKYQISQVDVNDLITPRDPSI